MCEPTTIAIASMAISAASAAAAAKGAADASSAQQHAAAEGFAQNQVAVGVQQQQVGEQSAQQMSARALDAARARGRLAAISADMGQGNSLDRQFSEISMAGNADQATMQANLDAHIAQGQLQKRGMRSQAVSAINTADASQISPWATGLQIAGGALNAAGTYNATKVKSPTIG